MHLNLCLYEMHLHLEHVDQIHEVIIISIRGLLFDFQGVSRLKKGEKKLYSNFLSPFWHGKYVQKMFLRLWSSPFKCFNLCLVKCKCFCLVHQTIHLPNSKCELWMVPEVTGPLLDLCNVAKTDKKASTPFSRVTNL